MLAGITKVGSKTLIHIDALEALYSKISSLPAKKKTVFDFLISVLLTLPLFAYIFINLSICF